MTIQKRAHSNGSIIQLSPNQKKNSLKMSDLSEN